MRAFWGPFDCIEDVADSLEKQKGEDIALPIGSIDSRTTKHVRCLPKSRSQVYLLFSYSSWFSLSADVGKYIESVRVSFDAYTSAREAVIAGDPPVT